MRTSLRIMTLLVGLGFIWLLAAPAAADKEDGDKIPKLIEQLGSGSFQEREAATKALDAIGAPALEKLRKAAQSDDVEVSPRAADLVKRIDKRSEVSRVLTPKRVHLIYKDTPIKEAVEDFKKKSGYEFTLHDPENKMPARKITLDTGDVTFWEALDQFCDKAGLAQATQQDVMQLMMRDMMERRKQLMQKQNADPRPVPVAPPQAPPAEKPNLKEPPARPAEENNKAPAKERGAATRPAGKQAAPAVVQEKAVPLPPVAAQAPPAVLVRPAMGMGARMSGYPMAANQIILMDGKSKTPPTHYAGAVRIRAILDPDQPPGGREAPLTLGLQVSAEPKLQMQAIVSTRIDKALDDNGQSLASHMPTEDDEGPVAGLPAPPRVVIAGAAGMRMPSVGVGPGHAMLHLKKGEKASKSLKELTGTLTVQMLDAPQPMITVDNVLKAGGSTTKGKSGGHIKIVEASKTEDGQVKLQVEIEAPPDVIPAHAGGMGFQGAVALPAIRFAVPIGAVPPPPPPAPADKPKEAPAEKPKDAPAKGEKAPAKEKIEEKPAPPPAAPPVAAIALPAGVAMRAVAGTSTSFNGLKLLDDKGKEMPVANVGVSFRAGPGGPGSMTYALTFQAQKGQGEPSKLVFSGSRTVTIDIPFTLKDVPLK